MQDVESLIEVSRLSLTTTNRDLRKRQTLLEGQLFLIQTGRYILPSEGQQGSHETGYLELVDRDLRRK